MNEAFKVNVCQSLDRGEKELKEKREKKNYFDDIAAEG